MQLVIHCVLIRMLNATEVLFKNGHEDIPKLNSPFWFYSLKLYQVVSFIFVYLEGILVKCCWFSIIIGSIVFHTMSFSYGDEKLLWKCSPQL